VSGSSRQTASRFSSHAATCWRRCHTGVTATRCNTLQHTATHTCSCSKLLSTKPWGDTATRCNTLQHASTRCNTLQHTATHCNTRLLMQQLVGDEAIQVTPQQAATRCSTLQHTATHTCSLRRAASCWRRSLTGDTAIRCNTLQHAATICNTHLLMQQVVGDEAIQVTLQHTAIRCNTLQHTATHCNTHLPMKKGSKLLATRPYR